VDDNAEASEAYNIKSMPTFVFFNNGQEVGRMSGADEAQLRTWVRRLRVEFAPAPAGTPFACFK
jgi:thioredoxin-like negative regulator of GroEL